MTEQEKLIREAQRLYKKEWRQKNKDKGKEANNRYWLKKAQQMDVFVDQNDKEESTNAKHI